MVQMVPDEGIRTYLLQDLQGLWVHLPVRVQLKGLIWYVPSSTSERGICQLYELQRSSDSVTCNFCFIN